METNKPGDKFEAEANLVCEALCREIANAGRWTHVTDAWLAMLKVRRMSKQLIDEQCLLAKDGCCDDKPSDT